MPSDQENLAALFALLEEKFPGGLPYGPSSSVFIERPGQAPMLVRMEDLGKEPLTGRDMKVVPHARALRFGETAEALGAERISLEEARRRAKNSSLYLNPLVSRHGTLPRIKLFERLTGSKATNMGAYGIRLASLLLPLLAALGLEKDDGQKTA
jgi:hypothetical protein